MTGKGCYCCRKSQGENHDSKWVWRPYPERYLVSAQIYSIIATIPTVINFVTLCSGMLAMLWFQLLWFRRLSDKNLRLLAFLAMFNALGMICAGLFVTFQLGPYFMDDAGHGYLAAVSIICGFVWFFVSFRLVWFLESGDHQRHEQRLSEAATHQTQGDIESPSEEVATRPDQVDIESPSGEDSEESNVEQHT